MRTSGKRAAHTATAVQQSTALPIGQDITASIYGTYTAPIDTLHQRGDPGAHSTQHTLLSIYYTLLSVAHSQQRNVLCTDTVTQQRRASSPSTHSVHKKHHSAEEQRQQQCPSTNTWSNYSYSVHTVHTQHRERGLSSTDDSQKHHQGEERERA